MTLRTSLRLYSFERPIFATIGSPLISFFGAGAVFEPVAAVPDAATVEDPSAAVLLAAVSSAESSRSSFSEATSLLCSAVSALFS